MAASARRRRDHRPTRCAVLRTGWNRQESGSRGDAMHRTRPRSSILHDPVRTFSRDLPSRSEYHVPVPKLRGSSRTKAPDPPRKPGDSTSEWEVKVTTQGNHCPKLKHRRSDGPLRFCVECGQVVNGKIPKRVCTEEEHAKRRLARSRYCPNCGEQLVK